MTLFAILATGFFLGMRHAADADHAVAVGSIVSRERNRQRATRSGAMCGLGHTVTILLAGVVVLAFGMFLAYGALAA